MIQCTTLFESDDINDINCVINHLYNKGLNKSILRRLRLPITINKCVIQNSSIHGKGVFALRDIKQGELITLYPPDYIKYISRLTGKGSEQTWYHCQYSSGGHLEYDIDMSRLNELDLYSFSINDSFHIMGDPLLLDNPGYLGHMINDGAAITEHGEEHERIYCSHSLSLANSVLVTSKHCIVMVYALRDIHKGQEILTSYGSDYWKCRLQK